jgi:L-2-hydroxyglutarate oxidase
MDEEVQSIKQTDGKFFIRTKNHEYVCDRLINCAGLHADRIAHKVGVGLGYTIVPFRGEYQKMRGPLKDSVNAMIYPVPDLAFPFLGIHWTKTIHGDLKAGPNAMLAFGRESYRFWDIHWGDCFDMLTRAAVWRLLLNPAFRRMTKEQIRTSLSQNAFIKEASTLLKGVTKDDFDPGPAGIRAQLVDRQGRLVDDIVIEKKDNSLHVLNAVSPGFTCSMAFAEYLCDQL